MLLRKACDMVVIADERTGKLDSGGNQQPVGWVSMFEMTELIGTGRRADFRRSGDTLTRAGVRCRCRATAWYVCRAGLHWSPLQFFACLGIEFVAEDRGGEIHALTYLHRSGVSAEQ